MNAILARLAGKRDERGQALGLSDNGIVSTATARLFAINGVDTDNPRFFPYAVWGGNQPPNIGYEAHVTYRSNSYGSTNVKSIPGDTKCKLNNCNRGINSNTFKGYFHFANGTLYIKPTPQTFSQGGNSIGSEPVADLVKYQQAGTPVILPVIGTSSDDSKNLYFTIAAFVCVKLDPIDTSGSSDWTGIVTHCVSSGHRDGEYPPALNIPSVMMPVLIH